MRSEELEQRTRQFNKFGKLLLKRYRLKFVTGQTGDEPAKRLGRYLRAARVNAGLSRAELAKRTRLPLTTISALETGLISTQEIEAGWLRRLAQALAEDVEDLELIFGPQTLKQGSLTWFKALEWHRSAQAKPLKKHTACPFLPETRLPLRSIYAACATLLICLMAVVWQYGSALLIGPRLPEETQESSSYQFQIEPEARINLLKAESGLKNRVWLANELFLQFSSDAPLAVARIDFDTKPPIGFSPLDYAGPSKTPERLNMLQAEQQLKIAALIQPAYLPVRIDAHCCGIQP